MRPCTEKVETIKEADQDQEEDGKEATPDLDTEMEQEMEVDQENKEAAVVIDPTDIQIKEATVEGDLKEHISAMKKM